VSGPAKQCVKLLADQRTHHSYAMSMAARGAKVVINDLGPSTQDKNRKAAEVVVEEITKLGGEAIANLDSNLDGAKIVKQAMDKWGRVDVSVREACARSLC
jgi:multifunctional beta-oxidation protein